MAQKTLSVLLAMSFLATSSTSSMARRAYSSYDYEHTKEAEVEYEPDSVQTKNVGYISDWAFLKSAETDATLKETLIKQAEGGDAAAMYKLASMYFHGKGVERDLAESFKWNRLSAFKGNALAQNNLGYMFDEGKGTKKDPAEALKWYRTAANFGCPGAQVNLGYLFEHGKGMPNDAKDFKQASDWYQKAADQGNLVAKRNLYLFNQQGIKTGPVESTDGTTVAQQTVSKPFASGDATTAVAPPTTSTTSAVAPAVSAPARTTPAAPAIASATAPVTASTTASTTASATGPATAPATPSVTPSVTASATAPATVAVTVPKTAVSAPAQPPAAATRSASTAPSATTTIASITTAPSPASDASSVLASAPQPNDDLKAGSDKLTALLRKMSSQRSGASASDSETKASEERPVADKSEKKNEVSEVKPLKQDVPTSASSNKSSEDKSAADKSSAKLDKIAETRPAATAPTLAKEPSPATPVKEKVALKPPAVAAAVLPSAVSLPQEKVTPAFSPVVSTPAPTSTSTVSAAPTVNTTSANATSAGGAVSGSGSVPAKDKAAVRPIRDKWALVVGISEFESPGIPKLDYSSKDATDFYNYLVNESNFAPDHVRLLLNDKATFRRVMSELGSKFLARVVKPDDLVLLYFSTHGSPSQMDIRGKNYLVAYDSDPNDLFATGIEMQKILESIQGRVLTDRVVLVMDACHSGFTEANSKGMGRVGNFNADELAQGSGQLVICSSEPTEQAWESTRYKNGVFTRKLLEGLRSKGPNTTLMEAYTATRKGVTEEVREDRAGVRQTPVLKGKWNGNDLIVAVPPASPQIVPLAVKKELEQDSASVLHSKSKVAEVRKETPKQSIALATPASSKEITKPKEADVASATNVNELVLTAKSFFPDSEPRELVRECYAALKSGSSHNNSELYYMRAQAYIQLSEWNNAINDLTDAIHGTPNKAQYYLARAVVHHKLGQSIRAREDIEEARFVDTHLPAKVSFGD